MRIWSGPNKGYRWSLLTRTSFIRGTYEAERCDLLADLLAPGQVFWDVGAHYGYTALLGARRVGPGGSVYAFEPNPENIWWLRWHIFWNELTIAHSYQQALADATGYEEFAIKGSGTGYLGPGCTRVRVETVDNLVNRRSHLPPDLMKIDVEGSEVRLLEGAKETLAAFRPKLLIATHSPELHEACRSRLISLDYEVIEPNRLESARKCGWHSVSPEPEILCFDPNDAPPDELVRRFIRS
ncbi:MAG TPA: FkbM family methyltransferase [Fimbriimonadaceae bacterium]|nr:FkbM family methyltransferase [Fimbriimonadaceae bacterium]